MDWNQPPGQGPNLEEAVARIKQKLLGFKAGGGRFFGFIALLVILAFLATSAYFTVDPEEIGVVQRFGAYVRQAEPGLHFKLPFGIEDVTKVKTGRVFKEEFGFRSTSPGIRTTFARKGFEDESLMLTGDLNVIDLKWIVQYRIREPEKWLFNIRDGRAVIRDLSEAVMRRIAGNAYATEVLTVKRVEISNDMHKELQEILSDYGTGVQVVTVQLQDVNPPEPVQPAFNEVNEARQEKERMINQAQTEYNKFIPEADGKARRTIAEAEGYAMEKINRAKGEANQFLDVLKEYRQAKEVTRRRLYLEGIQGLLAKAKKVYVVDEEQKALLPLLPMEGPK